MYYPDFVNCNEIYDPYPSAFSCSGIPGAANARIEEQKYLEMNGIPVNSYCMNPDPYNQMRPLGAYQQYGFNPYNIDTRIAAVTKLGPCGARIWPTDGKRTNDGRPLTDPALTATLIDGGREQFTANGKNMAVEFDFDPAKKRLKLEFGLQTLIVFLIFIVILFLLITNRGSVGTVMGKYFPPYAANVQGV